MLARTIKNIMNSSTAKLILDNEIEYNDLQLQLKHNRMRMMESNQNKEDQQFRFELMELKNNEKRIEQELHKRANRDMEKKVKKYVVDMLNLVFGCGEETDSFWQYVIEQCK